MKKPEFTFWDKFLAGIVGVFLVAYFIFGLYGFYSLIKDFII